MFISTIKSIFKYLEPAWSGNDGKISLRAVLAIAFSVDFIRNLSHAIYKWEVGRSMEGLSLTLGIEAGLIVGLLGLSTYQNMSAFAKTVDASTATSSPQLNVTQGSGQKLDSLPKD